MGYLNMLIRNIHKIFIMLKNLGFQLEESRKIKEIVLNMCWPRPCTSSRPACWATISRPITGISSPVRGGRRIDRLPATRYIWKLVLLLSLGGCFEYYDLFFTAYIGPGLVRSGLFSSTCTRGLALEQISR